MSIDSVMAADQVCNYVLRLINEEIEEITKNERRRNRKRITARETLEGLRVKVQNRKYAQDRFAR